MGRPAHHLSDDFRIAMRRLATTVSLITAGEAENWTGMAATAVMSVCADPPTLLIAVNRSASIHSILRVGGNFCVNLLSERHQDLIAIFSGGRKGADRFKDGAWTTGARGLPLLSDALASFQCRVETIVEAGTHTLFLGIVEQVNQHSVFDPLLWADGAPAALRPLQATEIKE